MIAQEEYRSRSWLRRHQVVAYFAITYAISWTAALAVITTKLLHHQSLSKLDGILMFPAMMLGPPAASFALTRVLDGKPGLRALLTRMRHIRVAPRWWLALAIPPVLVLTTLFVLKTRVSQAFTPGFFPQGIIFGCVAGFFEEIGWTGFALPRMTHEGFRFRAALLLGLLWGIWHLPVIDFLGAASPHGSALPWYGLAFIAAMSAIRILIAWLYASTRSIPLAQFMHAASTASLATFSPLAVSARQEALWYGVYAGLLWGTVLVVVLCWRSRPLIIEYGQFPAP